MAATDARAAVTSSEISSLVVALSSAVTPQDVARALAEEGAAAAGAAFSNMAVSDESGTWVIHGSSLTADAAVRWSSLDGRIRTPLYDAIVARDAVLLPDLDAITSEYPELVEDTIGAGLVATASLPLIGSGGEAAGAAGFGWTEPQTFEPAQLRALALIAHMAASALERTVLREKATQAERDREVGEAQLLQDIFLPRVLPQVENLEVAAVYLPASDASMGGDWYDVFPGAGGTCFVIGDVAGHGLQAAAVMAQLRNAARAYAVEHESPAAVMTQLNQMLSRLEPMETATAIVVVWDPTRGAIVRCNAGHPPILRCRPGETTFLEPHPTGVLLGADPSAVYADEVKQLRPGTTLLFFTDGLIERRGEDLTTGMSTLESLVDTLEDLSPQSVCDNVLDWRLQQGPREDDICVLAVRLA